MMLLRWLVRWRWWGFFFALALAACNSTASSTGSQTAPSGANAVLADRVIRYDPATSLGWPSSVDTSKAIGAPGGPLDAVPLGFDPLQIAIPPRGSIVLGFGSAGVRHCVVNRDGVDLVIYSTATLTVDSNNVSGTWSQILTVEVSNDNEDSNWFAFPQIVDSSKPLVDPRRYQRGYAGVTPTVGIGTAAQGGDAFDLADIPGLPLDFEACYIRITDAGMLIQDYGSGQPDPLNEGGGIDAVRGIHAIARSGTMP